ncbi:hypothetical protein HOY82DRAFT_614449 [Tuber indicum]|nr:hypothetical protein HOY82DRAFT_614449 [Tuber indicum]
MLVSDLVGECGTRHGATGHNNGSNSAAQAGGPSWFKAAVGRAGGSREVAEVGLMSSTSHGVCEVWNGEAIVWATNSPGIAEILYFGDGADGQGGSWLFALATTIEIGILKDAKEMRKHSQTKANKVAPPRITPPPRVRGR